MKVGDYCRYIDVFNNTIKIRKINKIIPPDKLIKADVYFFNNKECTLKEDIIKSSPKIINLIQAEDYVNGRKVYQVGYNFQDDLVLKMSINADGTPNNFEDFIYEKDIKSIVTKEQFSSMEYKVGE